jgi:predicted ATP-grasp superfamily ATP-dependent carboligase
MGFAEAMAAIESAWSLREAGFKVVAFSRNGSRPPLRHVRGVTIHNIPAPEDDAAAAAEAVQALAHRLRPAVLLPLDDHALWLCDRADVDVRLAGASGFAVECALDKSIQIDHAVRAGLPVPATQVLNEPRDAGPIDSPVMVKPARALYEVDGKLVRPTGTVCVDDVELRRAAASSWMAPMLIQPLIHGTGEGLFGHLGPRGVVAWSAHRRVRMVNPHGSASSSCRSQAVDRQLLEPSERFLKAIGWRGMFMLEFLRDGNGKPWFMELNGRAWGSMALARRRGFEYPAWTVSDALQADFEPSPPTAPSEVFCRNLGLELVHLMFVSRGPQSEAPVQWPRLHHAVRDVCRLRSGDCWYNWNASEPRVLFADTASTLGVYLRKIKRSRA